MSLYKDIEILTKKIYLDMSSNFGDRQCSRCKEWRAAQESLLTERVWLCYMCNLDDIDSLIRKRERAMNASSFKEFLEARV